MNKWHIIFSAMVGLARVAVATTSMIVCKEDNCLRAIQGSALPTRHGSADCSSYLLTTVTPSTTTITYLATSFVSSTSVTNVATTSSFDVTATSTLDVTVTDVIDITITVSTPSNIPPAKDRRNVNHPTLIRSKGINARQVTVNPSSIPAYASPCSGSVHYSSACYCVGATPRTVTAATPSTTTTVTIIATTVVTTKTMVDSTVVATITDATSIVTMTSTTITTATVTTSVPGLCGNAGLQFAFFSNPFYNADPPRYSNYDPTLFKNEAPEYSGTVTYINVQGNAGTPESIYGSPSMDPGNLAINHRGYLYASQSGTYTFTSTAADDINDIWLGSFAYSGWNRQNFFLENVNSNFVGPTSATKVLVAGQYYPLRIVFGNAQGGAACGISITAPDGSVVLDGNTGPSTSIVQFSCDGVTAPPYQPFGQET